MAHYRISALSALFALSLLLQACTTVPPGAGAPRTETVALQSFADTALAKTVDGQVTRHPGLSGFRLLPIGIDGYLTRVQIADAAERTLDVQYFILRSDFSGRAITDALLRAADRGVRVRILVDDGETMPGDDRIQTLDAHPKIEVRVFNPFAYRGHNKLLRALEFATNGSRLDYRMHNKLFVADNAVALVGGRNIADEYFQVDPKTQFADDDLFASGPVVRQLSRTFDDFWNTPSSIPVAALDRSKTSPAVLDTYRAMLASRRNERLPDGVDYSARIASGEPLRGMLSGRLPLEWAAWTLVCDNPDKKAVENGWRVGSLMERPVMEAASAVERELLMITPYLVPGDEGMGLFRALHAKGADVRILTNSLESSTVAPAQAGYMRYRQPLLDDGVDVYEVRSSLGSTRGSGQTAEISRFGNFSLHGKMFVFDRKRLFVGSMNFDQRSMHLNTEIGLLVDSPVMAQQLVDRFEAMTAAENAYHVVRVPGEAAGRPHLAWDTAESGMTTRYDEEPAKSALQKLQVTLLTWLPLDSEL